MPDIQGQYQTQRGWITTRVEQNCERYQEEVASFQLSEDGQALLESLIDQDTAGRNEP